MDWPVRSSIFIPAHKDSWVQKIVQYRPGAVVLDLEDAVTPLEKPAARKGVPQLLKVLHANGIGTIVRMNPLDEGGTDDLEAIVHQDLDAVMLPKAATVAQLHELDELLTYYEGRSGMQRKSTAILILPETPEGMQDARQLVAASPRVRGTVCGVLGSGAAGDFAQALGIWPSEDGLEQNYIVSKLSLDSRAGGGMYPIACVNGVKIDKLDKVRELTVRAKTFGYTGVLVIHPSHLAIVHEVFTPTEAEIGFYRGILAKMEETDARGNGAVKYQGEMIDYAMIARARQVLRDAERLKPETAG